MPNRDRFTEEEARAILKRAAERQHRADLGAEARAVGLSLADLEHAAAAAGIEPQHVAAAIRDAEREEPAVPASVHDRLTGKPTRIHLERVVPGRFDEALWQKLVVELRRTFDTPGIPSTLGALHEWRSNPSVQDQAEFLAEEVEGEVRLTLRRSWVAQASGALASLTIGGGMSAFFLILGVFAGNLDRALIGAAIFAALALVGFVASRVSYRRFADKQAARFEGLMERLEGIIEDHEVVDDADMLTALGGSTTVPTASTTPLLPLDDVESPLGDVESDDALRDPITLERVRSRTGI